MAMKLSKVLICVLLSCLFSGCATWAQHGVAAGHNKKFRIAVLPIEVTAEIEEISEITTLAPESIDEKKFIQEQMKLASEKLTRNLNSRLSESEYIEIVPVEFSTGVIGILMPPVPRPWSAEEFDKLKVGHDVQAVLLVRLAGYGKMKRKWLTYLIGIGVVEGVVQGILAAKLVDNTWVGVAVALEEIGQEILVWGGGSYLFGKYYAPVTLEAQLISTLDGRLMWDDTVFVSIDKKAIEALPVEDRQKKENQLHLTGVKAITELASDLNETAKSNLGFKSVLPSEPTY